MAKTNNLGLNLTTDESTKFGDWRKTIDGTDNSNMQIIDKAVGGIDSRVYTLEQNWNGGQETIALNKDSTYDYASEACRKFINNGANVYYRLDRTEIKAYMDVDGPTYINVLLNIYMDGEPEKLVGVYNVNDKLYVIGVMLSADGIEDEFDEEIIWHKRTICKEISVGSDGGGLTEEEIKELINQETGVLADAIDNKADKADIPTKVSQLTNDSKYLTSYTETDPTVPAWAKQSTKPSYTYSEITGKPTLATVATSGNYNDLSNTPTIPTAVTVDTSLSSTSTNPVQNKVINTALTGKLDTSLKGAKNGVAELDANGKVPTSQLPSYVDDVIEGTYVSTTSFKDTSGTAITGETGKIYVDTATNKTYRWSGSAYTEISASLALGTTSSTAYYGDKGQVAYDHSQKTSDNPHGVTKSDVGLGNVENKSSATIRGELTSSNVTTALGYTPLDEDDAYVHPTSHPASMITGLATVATSGSYNDLTNKPTIPTVNNGILTIQKNGTTVKAFPANSSSNVTANITVPTKVSELTNDEGFVTESEVTALINQTILGGEW